MKKPDYVTSIEQVPAFVDVPYICDLLQLHENTIRRMIKSGALKASKIGGVWRIPKSEIERLYEGGVCI